MKQTFHEELTEAFTQAGCALCRLGARSVTRYLDILAYENVNDVALRETIREGLGLCNRHAWQFVGETRAPLGTAIIYRDLIRTLQQRTNRALQPNDDLSRRLAGLVPKQRCVACDALTISIKDCGYQVHRSWADPSFRAIYAASDGLCWRHLLATLSADRLGRHWKQLLAAQRGCWERRIERPQRDQSAAALVEAIASAPRLNGTRIEETSVETVPAVAIEDDNVPPVEPGHCSVCSAVERWLGSLSPLSPPPARGEGARAPLSTGGRGVGGEGAALPCAVHAWHQARPRDGSEVATLGDWLRTLAAGLSDAIAVDTAGPTVLRVVERVRRGRTLPPNVVDESSCPWCVMQASYEAGLVHECAATTLCVPHLRAAARHGGSFDRIRTETRQTWRTIEAQLDEVIRKYDYRFQREPKGEEQASPRWAVELVAGVEGIR
jgi:hypothetical protein